MKNSLQILILISIFILSYGTFFTGEALLMNVGIQIGTSLTCETSACITPITFQTTMTSQPLAFIAINQLSFQKNIYSETLSFGFEIKRLPITLTGFGVELLTKTSNSLYTLKLSYFYLDPTILPQIRYMATHLQLVNLFDVSGNDAQKIINVNLPQTIPNPLSSLLLIFINGFTMFAPQSQSLKIFVQKQGNIQPTGFQIKIVTSFKNKLQRIMFFVLLLNDQIAKTNGRIYVTKINRYFSTNEKFFLTTDRNRSNIFIGFSKFIFDPPSSYIGPSAGFRFLYQDSQLMMLYNYKQLFLTYIYLQSETISPPTPNPPTPNTSTEVSFRVSKQSIIKDPQSNTLIFSIKLTLPQSQNISAIQWQNAISLGLPPSSSITYSYNSQTQILTAFVNYNQNLHALVSTITLALPSLQQSLTDPYIILTNNNLAANVYPSQVYQMVSKIRKSIYSLISIAFFVFFLGIYKSKVVVTEMMGVLQLSYLGLLVLNYSDPLIQPLYLFKYFNGYNFYVPKSQTIIPTNVYESGLNTSIIGNFNFMFGIALLPLFVSLILLIVAKRFVNISFKIMSWHRLVLGQWNFFIIIFCTYQFSSLVCLFALYSHSVVKWQLIINICISIIFGGLSIFSLCLYLLKDFNYMGQFKYIFKWNYFDLSVYIVFFISRILFSIAFVIGNGNFISVSVVIGLLFVMGLLIAIRMPYANKTHTARSVFNIIISAGILICYLILSIQGPTMGNDFYSKIPLIVVALASLPVFVSLGFVIKDIIDSIRNKKQEQQIVITNAAELQNIKRQQQLQNQMLNDLLEQQRKYRNQNKNNSLAKKMWLKKKKDKDKEKRKKQQTLALNNNNNNNINININRDPNQIPNSASNQNPIQNSNGAIQAPNLVVQAPNSPLPVDSGLTVERVMLLDNLLRNGDL